MLVIAVVDYQSTEMDSEERITTWANVMNGVTLQIIDTYDTHRGASYSEMVRSYSEVAAKRRSELWNVGIPSFYAVSRCR